MNNDKVSLMDVAAVTAGAVVLVIFVFAVPSESIAVIVGTKTLVILGTKVGIGLVLAVITAVGVNLVLNPKTAKQLMAEADKMAFRSTVNQLKVIAKSAREAKRYAKSYTAQSSLEEIATYLEKLADRYWSQMDVVGANQALNLFNFFLEELNEYLPIARGETMLGLADAKREIDDTENRVIPLALSICQKLGSQKDQGRLAEKDVAHGSFEEMAKSMGLLDDLYRDRKN